jgi:hypothetical protein
MNKLLDEISVVDTHSLQPRLDCKYPVGSPPAFLPNAKPDLTAKLLAAFWEVSVSCASASRTCTFALIPLRYSCVVQLKDRLSGGRARTDKFGEPEYDVLQQAMERVLVSCMFFPQE